MQVTKFEPISFTEATYASKCPVCNSDSVAFESDYPSNVNPFAGWRVFYCIGCGTGFVPETGPMLSEYYKVEYSAENRRDRDKEPTVYFSKSFRAKSPKIQKYFMRAKRQCQLLHSFNVEFNDVLDFGSGPGYFLLTSRPKRAYAFEPDEASKKYLDFLGAKRFSEISEIKPYSMDAVVASHSLEHLPVEELIETIRVLLSALKRNGKLLIEVPQGGHSYLHLDVRQDPHTIFFTPQGIVEAVRQSGGTVIYNCAVAKSIMPNRDNAIYTPKRNRFFQERRGGLVLVCSK